MKTRTLVLASAVFQTVTGVALILNPAFVVRLLFGAILYGAGTPTGHLAGFALLALGLACWPAQEAPHRPSAHSSSTTCSPRSISPTPGLPEATPASCSGPRSSFTPYSRSYWRARHITQPDPPRPTPTNHQQPATHPLTGRSNRITRFSGSTL
jgi:hypothetical protein